MLQTNAPMLFWGGLILGGLAVAALLIQGFLKSAKDEVREPVDKLFKQLGMDALPFFLSIVLAILWTLLFLILLAGLFGLIVDVLLEVPPSRDNKEGVWDWRFRLVQLTVLTTVLGAVVILPVTLQRLRLTREQTETAKASLFNEKITEAAADLHAQRQVTKEVEGKFETVWEDDVVRRNAAIDRLEGLVREEPQEAVRVSRLLSVYVRELSKSHPPQKAPDTDNILQIRDWTRSLAVKRSDMQNAVQVLGRLSDIENVDVEELEIDLSGANLQRMELNGLNFENAQMTSCFLDGARLRDSSFNQARMWSSSLVSTRFMTMSFDGTQLAGALCNNAIFHSTSMKRANLDQCKFNRSRFYGADLSGSSFQNANFF